MANTAIKAKLADGYTQDADGNVVTPDGVVIKKASPGQGLADGFTRMAIDKRFFKPEFCMGFKVAGVLIAADQYNSDVGPFVAYTVRLREPTMVCSAADDAVLEVAMPDSDVLIVATGALNKLEMYLQDQAAFAYVEMTPLGKVGLNGGKTFNRWQVDVAKKKVPRSEIFGAFSPQMGAGNGDVSKLPAGGVRQTTVEQPATVNANG